MKIIARRVYFMPGTALKDAENESVYRAEARIKGTSMLAFAIAMTQMSFKNSPSLTHANCVAQRDAHADLPPEQLRRAAGIRRSIEYRCCGG